MPLTIIEFTNVDCDTEEINVSWKIVQDVMIYDDPVSKSQICIPTHNIFRITQYED